MRLIDPTPELIVILSSAVMGACFCFIDMPLDDPLNFSPITVEMMWCDRKGWAGMLNDKCMGIFWNPIPLPSAGTCPGAYVLWTYDPNKPAICVRKA